jgi:hypothetical protein
MTSARTWLALLAVAAPIACTSAEDDDSDLRAAAASAGSSNAPFVRVNQIGYPSAASKRAYLMSSSDATGAAFTIRNASNAVVFSGTVGSKLGAWSHAYGNVHPIDFSSLATAGTYKLSVGAAVSPSFRVDSGANLYAQALANALAFYQTERDGPNYISGANGLRTAPGHLNDATARAYVTPTVNSSGHFSGDLVPVAPHNHLQPTRPMLERGQKKNGVQNDN